MKVLSIVGARPQFIKAAPVSRALRQVMDEVLVHTGQHYDHNMSAVFFQELDIPEPEYNLGVGSGSHGWQTGQMLIQIEEILLKEKPDWVLVYGDTNSTLAGAVAAIKLHIPLAHVEAGLRSFNRQMPEEHNRVLTDHASDLLFCPTQTAVDNLHNEGIRQGVYIVGDVMYDAVLHNMAIATEQSRVLHQLGLDPGRYILATVHRPRNTDDPGRLKSILAALDELSTDIPIVLPLHPRTRNAINALHYEPSQGLRFIDALGYLDMLLLEKHAHRIITDSGGVQKEAYFLAVPCLTLREETEWVETVQAGWNQLVGADPERILCAARQAAPQGDPPHLFGQGNATEEIIEVLCQYA